MSQIIVSLTLLTSAILLLEEPLNPLKEWAAMTAGVIGLLVLADFVLRKLERRKG